MDTNWLPVADVVEATGLSRQGVNNAARQVLRQVDLSRKGDNDRWLIERSAVDYYVEHSTWPRGAHVVSAESLRVDPAAPDSEMLRTIEDLRSRVESAELRTALATAAERAALLAEKDVRIEMLERDNVQLSGTIESRDAEIRALKSEYQSLLQARLAALD